MAISSVGLANLGFWGSLPMGYANYGGDTQIYNVPDYINTNINLGFNSQALASLNAPFMGPGCYIPQPPIPNDLAEQLAGALLQPVMEGLATGKIVRTVHA